MIYALDSNIVSFLLRADKNPEVVKKFDEMLEQGHDYVIPPLCYYEVYWKLIYNRATVQTRSFMEIYANSLSSDNMTGLEFVRAAEIRADLEKRGLPLGDDRKGDADVLIAAHCIINDYTLVTDNVSDFKRINGLKFVNWKR